MDWFCIHHDNQSKKGGNRLIATWTITIEFKVKCKTNPKLNLLCWFVIFKCRCPQILMIFPSGGAWTCWNGLVFSVVTLKQTQKTCKLCKNSSKADTTFKVNTPFLCKQHFLCASHIFLSWWSPGSTNSICWLQLWPLVWLAIGFPVWASSNTLLQCWTRDFLTLVPDASFSHWNLN